MRDKWAGSQWVIAEAREDIGDDLEAAAKIKVVETAKFAGHKVLSEPQVEWERIEDENMLFKTSSTLRVGDWILRTWIYIER